MSEKVVTVHEFEVYDIINDRHVLSEHKAQMSLIDSIQGARPIQGSEEVVPASRLDENGFYKVS